MGKADFYRKLGMAPNARGLKDANSGTTPPEADFEEVNVSPCPNCLEPVGWENLPFNSRKRESVFGAVNFLIYGGGRWKVTESAPGVGTLMSCPGNLSLVEKLPRRLEQLPTFAV